MGSDTRRIGREKKRNIESATTTGWKEYITVASDLQPKIATHAENGLNVPGAFRVVGSKVKWMDVNDHTD